MPQGLNSTHNLLEADASPTRNDLYETGDAWTLNLDHFREMLETVPDGQTVDEALVNMSEFAVKRFQESVVSNPNFYYGPVSIDDRSVAVFAPANSVSFSSPEWLPATQRSLSWHVSSPTTPPRLRLVS